MRSESQNFPRFVVYVKRGKIFWFTSHFLWRKGLWIRLNIENWWHAEFWSFHGYPKGLLILSWLDFNNSKEHKTYFRVHNTDEDDEGLDGLELYKAIHHAKQHDSSKDGMTMNENADLHDAAMGKH